MVLLVIQLRTVSPKDFFIKTEDGTSYRVNELFACNYFPPGIAPLPVVSEFPAEKKTGTCRIFVLGGTAAYGAPDPAYSFSRILEKLLDDKKSGIDFEIINCAMEAVNSDAVARIARECSNLSPDLFIIYTGNNEAPLPVTNSGEDITWTWRQYPVGDAVAPASPIESRIYKHLQKNLLSVCMSAKKCGAKVVLCTVPVNLRDCAPFVSLHRTGLKEPEAGRWRKNFDRGLALQKNGDYLGASGWFSKAMEIDDKFAGLHFNLAECFLAVGKTVEAAKQFSIARDLDGLKIRADSRINAIIREVAGSKKLTGVYLFDAARLFEGEEAKEGLIPGDDLFLDHVNCTFKGRILFVRALIGKLEKAAPEWFKVKPAGKKKVYSLEYCRDLLAYTRGEELEILKKILEEMKAPPFSGKLDRGYLEAGKFDRGDEEAGKLDRGDEISRLRKKITESRIDTGNKEYLPGDVIIARAASMKDPGDLFFCLKYIKSLLRIGKYPAAATEILRLSKGIPLSASWNFIVAALYKKAGMMGKAEEIFNKVIRMSPGSRAAYSAENELGKFLISCNRIDAACKVLQKAVLNCPASWEACNNLGSALVRRGLFEEAEKNFRRAVLLMPSYAMAQYNLAVSLGKKKKPGDMYKHLCLARKYEPGFAPVHKAIGIFLRGENRYNEALKSLRRALKLDPGLPAIRELIIETNQKKRIFITLKLNAAFESLKVHDYKKAVEAFQEVLTADPGFLVACNGLAWIYATSSDPKFRNGKKALDLALEINMRVRRQSPKLLDTLAASYGEAGDFEKAVSVAEEAHALALKKGMQKTAERIAQNIEILKRKEPLLGKPLIRD